MPSKADRVFKWKEIEAAKAQGMVWVVSKNNVYDVTSFVDKHPGGPKVLHMSAGHDITWLLETSHQFTRNPWKILESLKIGTVEHNFVDYNDNNPFYEEVVGEVRQYFKKTGKDPKDPLPSLLNFLIVAFIFLIGYFGTLKGYMLGALVIGIARALLGISTMHAASHFAISHNWRVWEWVDWFCFDIMMGGSSFQWNYQHVIGHHQHTNVYQADPDLPIVKTGDLRRVFGLQDWSQVYQYQAYYLPILYTFLGFKTRYYDVLMLLGKYEWNGPIKMNVQVADRLWLLASKLIFLWYQFYVPMFVFGISGWEMAKLYFLMDLATGAWLAYFFQVNHISDEILYSDNGDITKSKEWAALQVEGTVEYSHNSPLFIFLSGTLNYQSVHHLFPSIAPHHYPAISQILRKACKKHKVSYKVLPTYGKALWNHFKEMHQKGQKGENGYHEGF